MSDWKSWSLHIMKGSHHKCGYWQWHDFNVTFPEITRLDILILIQRKLMSGTEN